MSEIVTKDSERVASFLKTLDHLLDGVQNLVVSHKPALGGEHYLTDREVSVRLKVSRRTLQDWRTNGQIAYIMLGGKVLYAESDIQTMLTKNYNKVFE